MARSRYEYETSPRKLQPDVQKKKKVQKRNLHVVKDLPRQNTVISKEQRKRQTKLTLVVIGIFILLLTISYRNSQINESFSELKDAQQQLALLQKENEQLEVSIEKSLNLNDLEQIAREQLGMQKATSSQTKYISLPKKDYVEGATEEIKIEQETSVIQKIIDYIMNIF